MSLIKDIQDDIAASADGEWALAGTTLYALKVEGENAGENAWQAQVTQDGRYETPHTCVEAHARRMLRAVEMEKVLLSIAPALKDAETAAADGRMIDPAALVQAIRDAGAEL